MSSSSVFYTTVWFLITVLARFRAKYFLGVAYGQTRDYYLATYE